MTLFSNLACLHVSNVWGWAWAEGTYIEDDTLQDCDSTGKPRYRHTAGTAFLYYQDGFWAGLKYMCSWAEEHFYHYGEDPFPYVVPVGQWKVNLKTGAADQFQDAPGISVKDCGKLFHLS